MTSPFEENRSIVQRTHSQTSGQLLSSYLSPQNNVMEDSEVAQRDIEMMFPPKPPIKCVHSALSGDDLSWAKTKLIFAHGAGGTLKAEAIVNFTYGFTSSDTTPTILCFQGNMNLASRVKMFASILGSREGSLEKEARLSPVCLGGRSMGARAAVKAATEETTYLALVSYPLHTGKEVRDQILLDLPASTRVIFVSGSHDQMCDLERLEHVRRQMKCKTWRIAVQNADHGMNVRPKSATRNVGRMTGALVAAWLDQCDEKLTEGTISWDSDNSAVRWSGWSQAAKALTASQDDGAAKTTETSTAPSEPEMKSLKRKSNKALQNERRDEDPKLQRSKRLRKR